MMRGDVSFPAAHPSSSRCSSRALFDFEEENRVFEASDDRAYMALQLGRLDEPARPGVAFPLVRKLVAFNGGGPQQVEVVVLSRNDPVSGCRVFRSARTRARGRARRLHARRESPGATCARCRPTCSCRPTRPTCARRCRPACRGACLPAVARASTAHPDEVRIAFDGDAVLFSDEAEQVFQRDGLDAFQNHEREQADTPLAAGPFKPLLEALHRLQREPAARCASAPRWSPRAARRRTNARSAR
jgi:5'-nucleotidase